MNVLEIECYECYRCLFACCGMGAIRGKKSNSSETRVMEGMAKVEVFWKVRTRVRVAMAFKTNNNKQCRNFRERVSFWQTCSVRSAPVPPRHLQHHVQTHQTSRRLFKPRCSPTWNSTAFTFRCREEPAVDLRSEPFQIIHSRKYSFILCVCESLRRRS